MELKSRFDIIRCRSIEDIKGKIFPTLEKYQDLFPSSKDAKILLKPNLNSNMNALTGNTTDLRLLSALIQFLKGKGFSNIVVGEGTNSGFYRNKIGVISRLKVDELARYYGVRVTDLNYAEPYEIDFDEGVKAQVARVCIEADLFINLPKLKTHFEVGMSVCLKNLMGCLIGQENKKKTHQNLAENILKINQHVKPHFHIVDGLIAMEGLGPTRGTPVRLDTILLGTDPYLIDLVCAKIASFDYKKVRTLHLSEQEGLLTSAHHRYVESLDLGGIQRPFHSPRANPFAGFIHHPNRQKYFMAIRNIPLFSYLSSTNWFGKFLFYSGLRQDVFSKEEMSCDSLYLDAEKCNECGLCRDYCPLGLNLPNYLHHIDDTCIRCLYCFMVCPHSAIRFEGRFGFFKEQIKQYTEIIKQLHRKGGIENEF